MLLMGIVFISWNKQSKYWTLKSSIYYTMLSEHLDLRDLFLATYCKPHWPWKSSWSFFSFLSFQVLSHRKSKFNMVSDFSVLIITLKFYR